MASPIFRLANVLTKKSMVVAPRARQATTTTTGSFLPEPERQSYGMLSVIGTVLAGLFVGATISQNIASFLEENELFVPSDDDDDDD